MRICLYTIAVLAFLSSTCSPFEIYEKHRPSVAGVQIFVIDHSYRGRLDEFFYEIKQLGVDAVFLRVFQNRGDRVHFGLTNLCPEGGVYFASKNACVEADILKEAVQSAKKNGVKLFAWMATRSLSFLKGEDNISLSFSPDNKRSLGYGANIFKPDVRAALLSLFAELAEYQIDGILLQDDFIIKYAEGADCFACTEFTQKTGVACDAEEFFYPTRSSTFGRRKAAYDRWNLWKAEELSRLFSEIRASARLINPTLLWAVNIYYETPIYKDKGLLWYSHYISKFMDAGEDYIAVMAYHVQIAQEMKLEERELLEFLKNLAFSSVRAVGAEQAIFKVQVRRFNNANSPIDKLQTDSVQKALMNGGGENFIKLPINSPKDLLQRGGN
ncbi:MAG: family 10 glycosylhydrolase [Deferribacteraceae bacterium]|jgi:biofilm PGA synthesis lipoprotein PgaB|nr:family 10 glycosylhydrolase [Deferribacteraceae bacterium]